jgi:hypothetical protein
MLNIPATVSAPLPATYEAAKSALAHCQAIDECKDWADKAVALASYARQSEDLELEKMAIRIRERALRRASEIARQMMQPHGTNQHTKAGDHSDVISLPKEKVQEISGFSRRQLNNVLAIGNIPQEDFDRQVESANPPTVQELVRQGTQKRQAPDPETWLEGRSPAAFNKALHFVALFEEYAKELGQWNVAEAIECLNDKDRREVRAYIARIDAIHDKIITRI